MREIYKFAALLLVLGIAACGGGSGNQASSTISCADADRQDPRTSLKGLRAGMTIADAQAVLSCDSPSVELTSGGVTIPPSDSAPQQQIRLYTGGDLSPSSRFYAVSRQLAYGGRNTIPTARSRQEIEERYGPFRTFQRPIGPGENVVIAYSRLNGAARDIGDAVQCVQAVDGGRELEPTSDAKIAIAGADPDGLANCGVMVFVRREDMPDGTTVRVEMLLVDFPLMARLVREGRANQNRQDEQRRQDGLNQADERFREGGSGL